MYFRLENKHNCCWLYLVHTAKLDMTLKKYSLGVNKLAFFCYALANHISIYVYSGSFYRVTTVFSVCRRYKLKVKKAIGLIKRLTYEVGAQGLTATTVGLTIYNLRLELHQCLTKTKCMRASSICITPTENLLTA